MLLFSISSFSYTQKLEDGIYIGKNGGLAPEYALLYVSGDSARLDLIVHWQGTYFQAIGNEKNGYKPQELTYNEAQQFANKNVLIKVKRKKKDVTIIKFKVKNTFTGVTKFNLSKVDSIPENWLPMIKEAFQTIDSVEIK